jgi:hypothetical protein
MPAQSGGHGTRRWNYSSAREGIGVEETQDNARLVVTVRAAAGPGTFPEVELAGTRDGLVWLAERILRVAHAEQEMHTHLDAECHAPVYVSPGGWWLTIDRRERLRRARQTETGTIADGGE